MADDETGSIQIGAMRTGKPPVAATSKASPVGGRRREHEPLGGSDLLQDALDEASKQNPELSNG